MILQDLEHYHLPADWSRGAPLWKEGLWRLLGQPLLASDLPGTGWRRLLLVGFGAKLGRGGRLKPRLRVTFPWRLCVGDHCWIGEAVWIDNLATVSLGDRVCVSQGAYLCTGNHDFRQRDFRLMVRPIRVEHDAWIGARAVLAPGCEIGAGAVVSLAVVVAGRIPPMAIVRTGSNMPIGWRRARTASSNPEMGSWLKND